MLTVRVTCAGVDALDELARRWSISRSDVIRRLLAEGVERHTARGKTR